MVARLDRVTRSLLAWAELVERSRRRGWAIVVVAEGFDLSTDSGELTAALLASVAQYERRLIGARYGRPVEHAPEARHIVGEMRAAGAVTLQAIADRLTAEGISIPRGGPWRTSNVDGILRSLRLDAEAAQTAAPRSSAGPPAAAEILGNEIATAAEPDRHQAARSGPRALAGRRPAEHLPDGLGAGRDAPVPGKLNLWAVSGRALPAGSPKRSAGSRWVGRPARSPARCGRRPSR